MEKNNFNQFIQDTWDGKNIDPSYVRFRGMKSIVINIASGCGYTDGDLKDIRDFAERMKDKVSIYLFPSDDFKQEPKEGKELYDFCETYGLNVLYPTVKLMPKSSVTGKDNEMYQWLQFKNEMATQYPSDENPFEVKWNFHKFLINTDGTVWGTLFPGESLLQKDIIEWCDNMEIIA
jgi:glutathione peroxidase